MVRALRGLTSSPVPMPEAPLAPDAGAVGVPSPSSPLRDKAVQADIATRVQDMRIKMAFAVAAVLLLIGGFFTLTTTIEAAESAERAAKNAEQNGLSQAEINETRQRLDALEAKRLQLILNLLGDRYGADYSHVFITEDGKIVQTEDLPEELPVAPYFPTTPPN